MSLIALAGIEDIAGIGKKGEKRRKFFKNLADQIKKTGKFVTKFGAAPARAGFLEMVKLNVRSLGTNMKKAITKDPAKVRRFWEDLGGNYSSLTKAIEHGARQKRLGEIEDGHAIGVDPATMSALIAAGAAIAIAAVNKLGLGSSKEEAAADAQKFEAGKTAYDESVKGDIFKEAEGQETAAGDKILKSQVGLPMNLILLGGAGLLAFLLFKKK